MADSNITKKALVAALKELMNEMPFSKITIADICDHCGMNRKSFYYHFKDKYDLINWIFESEFLIPTKKQFENTQCVIEDRWARTEQMCKYFYDNKSFYSKVFKIKGQNCFSEYFRNLIVPVLEMKISAMMDDEDAAAFCVDFYVDAALSALERWMVEKNDMTPEEFISFLRRSINLLSCNNA